MIFALKSKSKWFWAIVLFGSILGFLLVFNSSNPLKAQPVSACSKPIECFTLGQQRLQQAQNEVSQYKSELQKKLNELEQLKSQISALQSQSSSVSNTANQAVGLANQAQNTANQAVGLANQAQNTANQAVGLANQVGGITRQGDLFVLPTAPNNVIHMGSGGICYYESGNRRWCVQK